MQQRLTVFVVLCIFCLEFQSVLIVFHILTIFCYQTQDGVSPLYVASLKGHTEVVDLLVQAGADIHLATTDELHVSTHTVSFSVAAVVELVSYSLRL